MSEIKHQWNGTVLTVISDSGASSQDLQGPKGDTGPRGPQGPGGVIYNEDGELVLDLSEYYLKSEVDNLIENVEVDLSAYATKADVTEAIVNEIELSEDIASKTYVSTEIAKAQLAEVTGDVDLSGFATLDDLANYATLEDLDDINIDNSTIIKNEDGQYSTAMGGGIGEYLFYYTEDNYQNYHYFNQGTGTKYLNTTQLYTVKFVYDDGLDSEEILVIKFATPESGVYTSEIVSGSSLYAPFVQAFDRSVTGGVRTTFEWYAPESAGSSTYITIKEFYFAVGGTVVLRDTDIVNPFDASFIPVDGETIIIKDGKLVAIGGGGSLQSSEEVYY